MSGNIKQYLSKTAQNIVPYQWEEGVVEKTFRFDTNTLSFPPPGINVFLQNLKNNCPINEYADPNYTKFKKLVAEYERVKPEMITITNSGDEAIDILAKTFLNPDDLFITTPPTYEMFTIQCEINRGINLPIPLKKETWEVNIKEIIKRSQNLKVKLIFLCNPNNPTGSVISQEEIEEIIGNSKAMVVIDEAYREFYGKSAVPLLKQYENLVVLRSFSKFAAMAGARVGYLIASKSLSQKFDSIRFPMGVSFLSYKLAEYVLEKDQKWIRKQTKMIKNERNKLSKKFTNLGFSVYPSQANFLLVKIGNRASKICQELKEKGLIIRDRSKKKYLEGCVRITVRSPKENDWLIKMIKEVL